MKIREKLLSLPVLGVIFAGLAVLVPVLVFVFSVRSKEFSFGVVAQSTLVDLSEERLADFRVVFQGEEMQRVESLTVRFENSGSIPIEAGDFEGPMVVRLAKESRFLLASVAERTPEALSPSISTAGNHLSIEPLLLNRGDSFSISLVIEGDPGVPELTARISDVPRVTRIEPPKQPKLTPGKMLGFGIVGLLGYIYLGGIFIPRFPLRGGIRPRVVPWLDGLLLTFVSALTSVVLLLGAFRGFDIGLPILAASIGAIMVVCVPVLAVARRRTRPLDPPRKRTRAGTMRR